MQMVLSFHGINTSLENLVSQLPMSRQGIDLCSLAISLRKFGFVMVFIDEKTEDGKHPIYKYTLPLFKKVGMLIPWSISVSDLRKSLNLGYPVILNIRSFHRPDRGHFVVVRNIGKKRMTINDPSYGQRVLSIKKIISSCHTWSGGAIILIPK